MSHLDDMRVHRHVRMHARTDADIQKQGQGPSDAPKND